MLQMCCELEYFWSLHVSGYSFDEMKSVGGVPLLYIVLKKLITVTFRLLNLLKLMFVSQLPPPPATRGKNTEEAFVIVYVLINIFLVE